MEALHWNFGKAELFRQLNILKEEGYIYFKHFKNLLSGDEKISVTVEHISINLWVISLIRYWEDENCIKRLQGRYFNKRIVNAFQKWNDYEDFKLQTIKDQISKKTNDEDFKEDYLEDFTPLLG